jgi:hypothetical protein
MMSISYSDLMPIRSQRTDAANRATFAITAPGLENLAEEISYDSVGP